MIHLQKMREIEDGKPKKYEIEDAQNWKIRGGEKITVERPSNCKKNVNTHYTFFL